MTELHVSPAGSDRGDGSRRRALAALAEAAAAARGRAARIVVHGGTYVDAHVTLTPENAGLIIEAADEPEPPVLCGGVRLTDWRRDEGDFWSAPAPPGCDARLLVIDGAPRPRARLPREGMFQHESTFAVRWRSTAEGCWEREPTREELSHLLYREGDLGPWLDVRSAELTIHHQWDDSCVGLVSLDADTRTLTFRNPAGYPAGSFRVQDYVVWNVREGMHEPGQWIHDRATGRIVYWPLPGEDMAGVDAVAPTRETLVRLDGREDAPLCDVTLRGLTLTLTNTPLKAGGFGASAFEGAVEGTHLRGCILERLTVRNVSGHGVRLRECGDVTVRGSRFDWTGAGGAYVINSTGTTLAENHVRRVGAMHPAGIGLRACGKESRNARIVHNDVADTSYSGITANGDGHAIEKNRIGRVMRTLRDGGAIYVTSFNHGLLRGNLAYDIETNVAHAYYLDELTFDTVVERNLAVRCAWPSHNHMSGRNTIRDNVFLAREDAHVSLPRCRDFTLQRNVICAAGDIGFRMPACAIASMPDNVLHSATGRITVNVLAEDAYAPLRKEPLEPRDGTAFADPLIAERTETRVAFRPDSPATARGIDPIDVSDAGCQSA